MIEWVLKGIHPTLLSNFNIPLYADGCRTTSLSVDKFNYDKCTHSACHCRLWWPSSGALLCKFRSKPHSVRNGWNVGKAKGGIKRLLVCNSKPIGGSILWGAMQSTKWNSNRNAVVRVSWEKSIFRKLLDAPQFTFECIRLWPSLNQIGKCKCAQKWDNEIYISIRNFPKPQFRLFAGNRPVPSGVCLLSVLWEMLSK